MAHKPLTGPRARPRFTRLSDDCPVCRLMEQLDREGLLEAVELGGDGSDGLETFVFKGPRITEFDRMTLAEAQSLLQVLPPEYPLLRRHEPPTLAQMVAVGRRYPGLLFYGYRVDPGGPADRVSLQGFYVPSEYAAQVLGELEYKPRACAALTIDGKPYWREWWA